MARQKQSKGACLYCQKSYTKAGLSSHLKSCAERADLISKAKFSKSETIYHLVVQDAYLKDFWLHLEMTGSARLNELDRYLRRIWLECCGHLSQFSIGGWSGEEIPMNLQVNRLFSKGLVLTHIYDFGTSSQTMVKVRDERYGKALTRHPITLMARNDQPESYCKECGKTAEWLCMECIYEYDEPGELCEDHADSHPHDEYGGPLPIVNSPRVGMCGYEGPAEAPY